MDTNKALLVAVQAAIRPLAEKPENRLNGTAVLWPRVASVMAQIDDDPAWKAPDAGNIARNRFDRLRRRNTPEQLDAMAAAVDPELYSVQVAALFDQTEAQGAHIQVEGEGGAPVVLDPHMPPADLADLLYENAKEQARLRQSMKKAQTVFHVRVPENLPIMHVWTADWHILDGGTDHDRFDDDCRLWLNTPGIYLGLGGDYANWFSPVVLARAMPANTLPSDYTEMIVRRKMALLALLILYGVIGNHDEMPGATGWHPVNSILRDLGKPDLGPGGRVFLQVGSVEYQIEARHSFNFNSVLNDTNSHRQLWAQAGKPDMVFTAHLHHPTMHHRTFDGDDTIWARNGSYKQEDHYAKSKNFVHTQAEPADQPGVILFPDQKKMIPFRDYRDGLALLAALRAEYSARLKQSA